MKKNTVENAEMSSTSKIHVQRNVRKEKTTISKNTNLPSKAKFNAAVEDRKSSENAATSRKMYNLRNPLSSSKVPIRLESRTGGHSKSNSEVVMNENNNKRKVNSKSKIIDHLNSRESPLPRENKEDVHLYGKKSSNLKRSSVFQNNITKNISHSHSKTSSAKAETGDKIFYGRDTIQPKKLLPNKGILKGNLNIRHLTSGNYFGVDFKKKTYKEENSPKLKKVKFKTLSLNDLTINTQKNHHLMDFRRPIMEKITKCDIIGGEWSKEKQVCEPVEEEKLLDWEVTDDFGKDKHLKNSFQNLQKEPIVPLKESADEYLQADHVEFLKTESQILTKEQNRKRSSKEPDNLKAKSIDESLEKVISQTEQKLENTLTNLQRSRVLFSTDKTVHTQVLSRKELLEKEVNEKVRILTAEFLQCIKKGNKQIPRLITKKKNNSKYNTGQESCPKILPPLNELQKCSRTICADEKTLIANNKLLQENILKQNDIPQNMKSFSGCIEHNDLQTSSRESSPFNQSLNQCETDVIKSPRCSRIPRPSSSKKESLSPLIETGLNSDVTHGKGTNFSSRSERKNTLTELLSNNLQSLCKTEAVREGNTLKEDFNPLQNSTRGALLEGTQFTESKYAYSTENCQKNNEVGETCQSINNANSSCLQDTDEFSDIDRISLDRMKGDAEYSYEHVKATTVSKVHMNTEKENTKENYFMNQDSFVYAVKINDKVFQQYLPSSVDNEALPSVFKTEENVNENIPLPKQKEKSKRNSKSDGKRFYYRHKKKIILFPFILLFCVLLFRYILPV